MPISPAPIPSVSVNLLEHEEYEDSVINRLISWAVTYGRYIMIGTEIIVLLAFISRFSLDRKLTDLREEINQKQIILKANQQFEDDFKATQKKLTSIRKLLINQKLAGDTLFLVSSLLPTDVYLDEFHLVQNKVTIGAISGTTNGFSQFLATIGSRKEFTNVEITDIRKNTLVGVEFKITATLPIVADTKK